MNNMRPTDGCSRQASTLAADPSVGQNVNNE